MKRIITSALVLALTIGAAQAQTTDSQGQKKHHHNKEHRMAFDKLNLTADQKSQLKSIREDYRKQFADLKKQDQLTVADMKIRRQELHKQFREKMESVLTPAQKDQLAKIRADWKANHKDGTAWKGHKGRGFHNGAELQKKLDLSQDQVAQLTKIRSDFRSQFQSIRNDNSLTQDQKKDKMKSLMKQQKEQMKTVLTKEQLEKFQSLKKERSNRDTK